MQISNTATYSPVQRMVNGLTKQNAFYAPLSSSSNQQQANALSFADKVTLSSTAKELSAQAERGVVERPVPLPEKPPQSDLKSDYIALKKAQYKYRVAADGVNLAAGNNQGLSASSVHYLSHHDEARKQAVTVMAAQSQAQLAEHYMAQNMAQNSEEEQDITQTTPVVAPYTPTLETALLAASTSLLAKYGKEEQASANMSQTAA
ncbi:hypothetical protein [Motilimonas sp. KMU-193]|uniref:hypothetical protein n=1 Tax=Motilimonas sp. KMU-193 TaxID=3388668 RepID=UPI00396B020D